jgi:hypothetical protein
MVRFSELRRSRRPILAAIAMCAALALPGHAGTLVLYPFTSNLNPSVTAPGITSTLNTSHLGFEEIGTEADDTGFGPLFEAYPPSGINSAMAAYLSGTYFSLTVDSTQALGDLDVSFLVGSGSEAAPRGFFVLSSLNNFATSLDTQTVSSTVPLPQSFDLDAGSATSVTLHFFVWSPEPGYSVDFSNLEVSTATPEPASMLLTGSALVAVGMIRRDWLRRMFGRK